MLDVIASPSVLKCKEDTVRTLLPNKKVYCLLNKNKNIVRHILSEQYILWI